MIEAQAELVFVLRLRERGDEGGTACVRQRIERENVLRNRIDARQLIERNGLRRLSLRNEYVVKLVIPVRKLLGIMNRVVYRRVGAMSVGIKRKLRRRIAHFAEIAGTFGEGRYPYTRSFTLPVAEALVVAEEESFVALDGTTQNAAHLVAMQRLVALGKTGRWNEEEISRIQSIVSKEPVHIPMQVIAPAFQGRIDQSRSMPIFGGHIRAFHTKFL